MTQRKPRNIAASIHQRLLNKARQKNRPFNEVLQYYAMERFLYRLSRSPHAEKLVLKGALMLAAWIAPFSRPTMDIDFLGRIENSISAVTEIIRSVCAQKVDSDGLVFDTNTIVSQRIVEQADYEGVRVRFKGSLGNAKVFMQLDIGFGDKVVPRPRLIDYPSILDMPPPRVHGYSRESTIAEKLETMIKLGVLNSRMKDFYDIWFLSRSFDFGGETLTKAIEETFKKRDTDLNASPTALLSSFTEDPGKQDQWNAFIRRTRLEDAPTELKQVMNGIVEFVGPITNAIAIGRPFSRIWKAPGPWNRS